MWIDKHRTAFGNGHSSTRAVQCGRQKSEITRYVRDYSIYLLTHEWKYAVSENDVG
jgi:hypothetical protein